MLKMFDKYSAVDEMGCYTDNQESGRKEMRRENKKENKID